MGEEAAVHFFIFSRYGEKSKNEALKEEFSHFEVWFSEKLRAAN